MNKHRIILSGRLILAAAISALIFGTAAKISAQTCTAPPAGMVAWLPGDGSANDISGNNNNGALENGTTFADGKVAQAFSFDGVNDSVRVPSSPSLAPPSGRISVDAWVNPTAFVNTASIVNKRTSGNVGGYVLEYQFNTGGRIGWNVYVNGAFRSVVSNVVLPLNTWTQVTGTYDGTTVILYFNGQSVGSTSFSGSISPVAADVVIGRNQVNSATWQGLIDEVEIFDRALSQSEIQAIVAADSAGKCKAPLIFIVNTTSDTNDGACNTTHCSLREAIIAANANTVNLMPDRIEFNISGSGTQTIMPTSALPPITNPVVIDGYTQPGAMPNTNATGGINAVLKIELNGASAGSSVNGLRISASGSIVRGLVINKFVGNGIRLDTNGNLIEGNFIGTNASGTVASANTSSGVAIFSTSSNNTIGGTTPAVRNLISGSDQASGIEIGSSSNNLIQGNLIGTDATGTIAIGNYFGIQVASATALNNTVGGTTTAARNVISGNGFGIYTVASTIIQGNFIGTDANGSANLGNRAFGIFINGSNNTIGGTAAGASNIIAFSGQEGVTINNGTGTSVLSNSIFSNVGMGIDLINGSRGTTLNDLGDADTGANNLQNFPVLTSSANSGNATNVSGTFNSTANTQFRVEFFSNAACSSSDFGEGETFIGFQNATTDANGNATINFTPSAAIAVGRFVTSTATDPAGNTSEFSRCVQNLGTTAAKVSIGGRVTTASGRGIINARLSLTDSQGNVRTAISTSFGYYRFADVEAGTTYILTATGKRFTFSQPSQVLNVSDEMDEVNFIGLPVKRE